MNEKKKEEKKEEEEGRRKKEEEEEEGESVPRSLRVILHNCICILFFHVSAISPVHLNLLHLVSLINGKAIPIRRGEALRGCRRLRLPEFTDNRNIKVASLSALSTVRPYPQDIFPVLTPVRG